MQGEGRDDKGVHLTVAGRKFGPWKFEGTTLGLAPGIAT